MNHTLLETQSTDTGIGAGRWMVVIYNNETNLVDEVVDILMRATGCSIDEAEIETWEAHHYGKTPVHFSSQDECNAAAEIIQSIGVKAEVSREWEE